jgi:gluconate kinase
MPPHLLDSQLQTLELSGEEELFLHFAPGAEERLTAEQMADAIAAKLDST